MLFRAAEAIASSPPEPMVSWGACVRPPAAISKRWIPVASIASRSAASVPPASRTSGDTNPGATSSVVPASTWTGECTNARGVAIRSRPPRTAVGPE